MGRKFHWMGVTNTAWEGANWVEPDGTPWGGTYPGDVPVDDEVYFADPSPGGPIVNHLQTIGAIPAVIVALIEEDGTSGFVGPPGAADFYCFNDIAYNSSVVATQHIKVGSAGSVDCGDGSSQCPLIEVRDSAAVIGGRFILGKFYDSSTLLYLQGYPDAAPNEYAPDFEEVEFHDSSSCDGLIIEDRFLWNSDGTFNLVWKSLFGKGAGPLLIEAYQSLEVVCTGDVIDFVNKATPPFIVNTSLKRRDALFSVDGGIAAFISGDWEMIWDHSNAHGYGPFSFP